MTFGRHDWALSVCILACNNLSFVSHLTFLTSAKRVDHVIITVNPGFCNSHVPSCSLRCVNAASFAF